MDAAIRSNISIDDRTPLYAEIRCAWAEKLAAAVRSLPRFEWEVAGTGQAEFAGAAAFK